jgi:hypothetical protein
MQFSIYERDAKFVGELLYIRDERSLLYKPFCTNANVSIMCGNYTGIDAVIEVGMAVHISGLNHDAVWLSTQRRMPVAPKGDLLVEFDNPPLRGSGIDYDRSWRTYHNKKDDCICIGKPRYSDGDSCVEFANGIVAVLRGSHLVAIWAKIREI